jgi:hypothetical protein
MDLSQVNICYFGEEKEGRLLFIKMNAVILWTFPTLTHAPTGRLTDFCKLWARSKK